MASILDQFRIDPVEPIATPAPATEPAQQSESILSQFVISDTPPQRVAETAGEEFSAGLSQATDNLQMTLFGLTRALGREFGFETIEELGSEGIDRNALEAQEFVPSVGRIEDIEDADDLFSFMAQGAGQLIPSISLAIGSGGITGALAKKATERSIKKVFVNRMVNNMVARGTPVDLARAAAEKAIRSNAGFKMMQGNLVRGVAGADRIRKGEVRGRILGAGAASVAPQTGEADISLTEAGVDSFSTALAAGLAGGSLEALPALRLLDRMFPGIDKAVAGSFVKDFAKSVGKQTLLEAGTEGAQEVIQQAALAFHDPSFDFMDPDNVSQVANAAAIGAIGGLVTGGLGEVGGGLNRLSQSIAEKARTRAQDLAAKREIPEFKMDLDEEQITDPDFVPADNTFFEEVRGRVNSAVDQTITPVMNTVRTAFQKGIDDVAELAPSLSATTAALTQRAADAQQEFVEGHKHIIADTKRWARQQTEFIAETAEDMFGPEKQAYVNKQMAKVKAHLDEVATVLKERADQLTNTLLNDVDGISVFDEDATIVEEPESQFVFGKDGTEGDLAQGWVDKNSARTFLKKLRRQFLSANDSTFEIRKNEDGRYTVVLADSGQASDLRDDLQVTKALEAARQSARKNPNLKKKRTVVSVQRKDPTGRKKGHKGPTKFDILTLAIQGKFLDNGDNRTVGQGFAAVVGRMLERGIIDGEGARKLQEGFNEQFSDPNVDIAVAELDALNPAEAQQKQEREASQEFARTRADRAEITELQDTLDGGELTQQQINEQLESEADATRRLGATAAAPTPRNVLQPNIDRLKRVLANFPAESERTPADQREFEELRGQLNLLEKSLARKARPKKKAASKKKPTKKRVPPKREPEAISTELNSQSKAEVFMPGADRNTVTLATDVTNFVRRMIAPNRKVRVINFEAARRMIAKNHPHANRVQALLDQQSPGAMLYGETQDAPTYILIDTEKINTGETAAVLMHELGHVIHYDTWAQLSAKEQDQLWKAFEADVVSGKRKTGKVVSLGSQPSLKDAGTPEAAINMFEFKEWMADNFVSWMNNRAEPKNAVEQFFERVGKKIDELWQFMTQNEGRFELLQGANETYETFIQEVATGIRRAHVTGTNPFYLRENATGRSVSVLFDPSRVGLPAVDSRDTVPRGLSRTQWNEFVKRVEVDYPLVVQRARTMTEWMHNAFYVALAPSTSAMRNLSNQGIKAADQLIEMFNRREHGKPRQDVQNYHQAVKQMKSSFLSRHTDIVEGLTDAQKADITKRLRAHEAGDTSIKLTLREKQLRKLFDDMHAYAKEAKLPMGKIENYFPKIFSRELLVKNEEKIVKWLMSKTKNKNALTREKARSFYNSLISSEADEAAALREMQKDELSMQTPSFKNMRSRTAADPFFDQFLETNLDGIVGNYVNSVVKRAEFNRRLGKEAKEGQIGGDALPKSVWNSREKLEGILRNAKSQGATEKQLQMMKNYVDANLGMYGRDDVTDTQRKIMAGVIAYQNMRVLMFTVFASLPDVVGPAIRSGNMRQSFKSILNNMRDIVKSDGDLHDMARAFGAISDAGNQHIMTEYVDTHYMPPTLRKWNEGFFKWTGLNFYTDVTRKMALAVGRDFIKTQAKRADDQTLTPKQRAQAKAALAELGLTKEEVNGWVALGERAWGGTGYDNESAADKKVAEGLLQFVDESIMSPNPSQRPILASHPAAMLVYHLKGFLYAFHDVILKRLAFNFDQAGRDSQLSPGENYAQIAGAVAPALLIMALTALGLELREMITGEKRTDRMDGWEYVWTVTERSGLLGISQLGFDFESASARGQSELAGLLGPSVGHLGDLISRPLSQTIPKSIPGVSQLPWARNALREYTPL